MKNGKIRLQPNTDAVDIRDKCLGISVWIEGDSVNLLNTNRGLHTQIRHNGDKATFEAANRVSRLIAAAPDMLEALEMLLVAESMQQGARDGATMGQISAAIDAAKAAIRKVKGVK